MKSAEQIKGAVKSIAKKEFETTRSFIKIYVRKTSGTF